ncbi:MAG: thioredoxin domain-containing protein [Bacteroidales bacterium]|nr:thioredoxin domain-containing protein [Bacteroidales bacterium]
MDGTTKQNKFTNRLIYESSPYLLQHADNPVDWHPWGDEPFEKARKENKLVLISIGYAACHWCHVMEHESFSDQEVARMMNQNYICIKVDREERPDVDSIYMDAVHIMTGSGGWPLNCFALPDGRPVYGGTYFRKSQWKQVLMHLTDTYRKTPNKLEVQANEIKKGVQNIQPMETVTTLPDFQTKELKERVDTIKRYLDDEFGGIKGTPKFPMPVFYQFLLKHHFHTGEQDLLDHILFTLKKMEEGGIYDHLGGGFARYSTDKEWMVPHFEKMLYDNAQLAVLYSQAYLYTRQEHLKDTVTETLDFLQREMMSEENLFYSSIDADNEEGEGAYYTWSKEEVEFILHSKSDILSDYFGIQRNGDRNSRNVISKNMNIDALAEKYNLSYSKVQEIVNQGKKTMWERRKKRSRPATDKKVITAWNALAIKAFIHGYRATGKSKYLRIALTSAEYLIGYQLRSDYRLKRIYIDGRSSVNAFLDDYAYLTEVLLELFQITFDGKWVDWAYKLTEFVLRNFTDARNHLFNYVAEPDKQLISNKIEVMDAVLPSSNSVYAKNLFILGQYLYIDSYIERARKMLAAANTMIPRNPLYFSNWLSLMIWFVYPPYEISIVGRKSEEYRKRFENIYHPGVILAGGTHEGNLPILKNRFKLGKTQIYICKGQVCQKPLNNVEEALKKIV